MATEKQTATTPSEPVTMDVLAQFADRMSQGIVAGIAEARPKKVSFGEYQRREAKRTPKPEMARDYYQNGHKMDRGVLTAKEIALLNRVQTSGRYFDRLMEVIVRTEGNDNAVEFRYKNKEADDRNALRNHFRNWEDALTQIVEAQEADVLEKATAPGKR